MKQLLLITGLCLHTALHTSAAARDEAPLTLGKKGRVLVRMPYRATSNNPESNPIPKPQPAGGIRVITVGGTGWPKKIDGPRGVSAFRDPFEVAIDANGDAIISEHWNHDVRKISGQTYVASTVASGIRHATGLDIDRFGNIYVSRYYGPGCRGGDIMRLTPSGQRKIIQKGFFRPTSVCVDEKGTLWVADTPKDKIIRIQPDGTRKIWDDVHASHIALGPDGSLYCADYVKSCVRRITPKGTVEIVAGMLGRKGQRDGAASQALFQGLYGIAVSPRGTIFVTDGHAIRKISPEGVVSTVAGHPDESGNIDGTAAEARFLKPCGLALDRKGNLWVTCRNGYVRLIMNVENENSTTKGPASRGGGWQADDIIYDGWKIRGPKRFRDKLIEDLQVLENETPLFYAMAQKTVKMFRWHPKSKRSWAYPPHGNIGFVPNDFEKSNGQHRTGWFFLVVIHEIQHCSRQYGHGSEAGACYAMYYYGSKTKGVRPAKFLLNYSKALALKRGYDATDWKINLSRLRTGLNK
jgi:sugar lactone lactonase YvrE